VEVPSLPTKYFRQFQKKEIPLKPKAPIEEGIKAEDILDRILKNKMTVTVKTLDLTVNYAFNLKPISNT